MAKHYLIYPIVLSLFILPACGGEDSPGGAINLASLTGVYQFTSVETNDAARTIDVSSMGIYYIVTDELVARYGRNGVCYDYSLVKNESTDGDTVTATIQPQEGEPGVPTCVSYLGNIASTARSNALTEEEKKERQEAIKTLAKGISIVSDPEVDSGYTASFISRVKAIQSDVINLRVAAVWLAGLGIDVGGNGGGDKGVKLVSSCDGVSHGSGSSEIMVCVKLKNVPLGTPVKFQIGGKNLPPVPTNQVGGACAAREISSFGNYRWAASINRGMNVAGGVVRVGSKEKHCVLR